MKQQEEEIEAPMDTAEEKSVITGASSPEHKPQVSDSEKGKSSESSINRDDMLARVEKEKRLSLIKAWEESEKSKAENRAHKKLSSIGAWEKSKEATMVAELKSIEEELEKKKAEYVEKKRNEVAQIHKVAQEKRATIEAKREEDILKAEKVATKYCATGGAPNKLFPFL